MMQAEGDSKWKEPKWEGKKKEDKWEEPSEEEVGRWARAKW